MFYKGDMTALAILWDASHLWGLLAWRAAVAFRLPYRLVKAQEIAQGTLSDKTSLLLVPGGTARHKFAALGEKGRQALRDWVEKGGHYVGFCGGAGLGLNDGDGLGLCPWRRARITEWVQHFVSGHVRVELHPGHTLTEQARADGRELVALPIWWPGRFAVPAGTDCANTAGEVTVLARYAGLTPAICRDDPRFADFQVADMPLSSLSDDVLVEWARTYGVSLAPAFLDGQPCVLHGARGKGTYTLSYSHLETPGSPEANRWLASLLGSLSGGFPAGLPAGGEIPAWRPEAEPTLWRGELAGFPGSLAEAREHMAEIMRLGMAHGLLFSRTPWLTGWRSGVAGAALNNLYAALCVATAIAPTPEAEACWQRTGPRFIPLFNAFAQGVRDNLLAFRLSATMPEAVPRHRVMEQRNALFGTAMESAGPYKELLAMVDEVLFLSLHRGDAKRGAE